MIQSVGYAAKSVAASLERFEFERRDVRPDDVVVEIAYSGICHSDIHQVRDEWGGAIFPMVPGHEIVGYVTAVGSAVTKFKVGDLAGVGVMVDSCKVCSNCEADEEAYCEKGFVGTYNSKDYEGVLTRGGYSNNIVVAERYVHTISKKLEPKLAAVAPLLCAGITTYSPLRHWKIGPGKKVGIVGLGGLGHMGLKFAHSFGAHVVLFTTSAGKEADALRLGADEVVISKDAEAMAKYKGSLDFILDCVSAPHDINLYLSLLRLDGTVCLVGLPETPMEVASFSTVVNRRSLAGSMIGGMKETQEMLDYCAENDIVSEIELTTVGELDTAYDRVVKSDVKYRFVIDMKSLNA
ncbi:NAD(P)-dependent alcohol dehydrogenase [Granulicella sp. WH15]|uniref:NAD(P)-dependent alcohol dehydrogenase n=1 Tax=Granulicella sp. WH15 TaxID=2602070 RepID=UPI00136776E9|nr:NAD(P)-dependent alcohol dehydrogenase [Granulicella sp. WH15]QHN05047.1 NAD(P)-dependent alcohol dehydrogenase [Granulicella sp. WH15]